MFRNAINSVLSSLDTLMRIPKDVAVPVRFRYFRERPTLVRRYGYKDKLAWSGPLPRLETKYRLPRPEYAPLDPWHEKKAVFGQNDYIDILGDPKLHPVLISYNVPAWLRGFYGNEYQVLIRKRAFFGRKIDASSPTAFHQMQKNMKFQYKFLNYRRPQHRMPKSYYRDPAIVQK